MSRPKIIGHKGACGHAPENTIASFKKAMDLGCARTELDVRLTADHELVVIHDDTVDRTTNGKGKVSTFALAELQGLRCDNNETIPTLRQVIDICKNKIDLQIELKEAGTPALVSQIIRNNGMVGQAVISSFEAGLLKEIKESDPALKAILLFDAPPPDLWLMVKELSLYAIGPRAEAVTPDLVKEAHAHGVRVYAFHANDKELGEKIIRMGVDDLGTDFPDLFMATQ